MAAHRTNVGFLLSSALTGQEHGLCRADVRPCFPSHSGSPAGLGHSALEGKGNYRLRKHTSSHTKPTYCCLDFPVGSKGTTSTLSNQDTSPKTDHGQGLTSCLMGLRFCCLCSWMCSLPLYKINMSSGLTQLHSTVTSQPVLVGRGPAMVSTARGLAILMLLHSQPEDNSKASLTCWFCCCCFSLLTFLGMWHLFAVFT